MTAVRTNYTVGTFNYSPLFSCLLSLLLSPPSSLLPPPLLSSLFCYVCLLIFSFRHSRPKLSANKWRVDFGLDADDTRKAKIEKLESSRKGFAAIFDWEIEEGRITILGNVSPPPPLRDINVIISETDFGAVTTKAVTITAKMAYNGTRYGKWHYRTRT